MTISKTSRWEMLYKYKVHHVLLWIGYYVFWVLFYKDYYPSIWVLILVVSVYFVFLSSAYYSTAYFLFPRYLYKQKFGRFFLFFGLLIIGLSLAQGYILYLMFKNSAAPAEYRNFQSMVQYSFMAIVTMVGLLAGAKLFIEKIRSDRANRSRDQQRIESELQYLKAQVNPHFLFNAINSVYFLIKKDPNLAAETLIKLSDLLRFQLYDCSDEKIAIEKEIEYLNNFITLEKIRKGEKVSVQVDMNGSLSGFHIAPFLLIPFVENAFKHVSTFSNGNNAITIKLHRDANELLVHIENTTEKVIQHEIGGIGLKNVKRRLELLYPQLHQLKIHENHDRYIVHLSLRIS